MAGVKKHLPFFDRGFTSYSTAGATSAIKIPSNQAIEEWYKKGIGELGLSLSTFYCLTPYELDLAYEGYLRRQELQANLIKLAVFQAQQGQANLIKIIPEKECSLGSLAEREATFRLLNIQEEDDEL